MAALNRRARLTQQEVAAMWLWSAEYAESGLGAVQFLRKLDPYRSRLVADFVKQMNEARPYTSGHPKENETGEAK